MQCTVPLQPGVNTLVIYAQDAAGNGASSGVRVTRAGTSTALHLTPSTRTVLVGESFATRLVDEYGVIVTAQTWTSSDPTVVTVDAEGVAAAIAPGQVTITATRQSLSAQATISVMEGQSLPNGTSRWTVAPSAGMTMSSPIYTHRVDDTGPDLFSVETDSSGQTTVRALYATGESLWTAVAPGTPVFGDSFGGVVAELRDEYGDSYGLARFAGPANAPPWSYESPNGYLGTPAQAPDGTIYAVEVLPGRDSRNGFIWDVYAIALDGNTGRVMARVPLPRDVAIHEDEWEYEGCHDSRSETWPEVLAPIVGSDGNGYFQVRRLSRITRSLCGQPETKEVDNTLTLLRLAPTGTTTSDTLNRYQHIGNPNECEWVPEAGQTLPDGLGGVLATWWRTTFCNPEEDKERGCLGSMPLVPAPSIRSTGTSESP